MVPTHSHQPADSRSSMSEAGRLKMLRVNKKRREKDGKQHCLADLKALDEGKHDRS